MLNIRYLNLISIYCYYSITCLDACKFLYIIIMKLIEAVPNISEGCNSAIITALVDFLRTAQNTQLLGYDANPSANRTVFTLIGEQKAIYNVLFDFISLATRLIDMRIQHGAHPRLGAVDVCPLIPLQNISLQETAHLAQQLGKRLSGYRRGSLCLPAGREHARDGALD